MNVDNTKSCYGYVELSDSKVANVLIEKLQKQNVPAKMMNHTSFQQGKPLTAINNLMAH